jgi:hypothetical protein
LFRHVPWLPIHAAADRTGGAGANRFRFTGRLAERKLKLGRYR